MWANAPDAPTVQDESCAFTAGSASMRASEAPRTSRNWGASCRSRAASTPTTRVVRALAALWMWGGHRGKEIRSPARRGRRSLLLSGGVGRGTVS
eukprot:6179563-Pleurochrysis_carterae.AAC.1